MSATVRAILIGLIILVLALIVLPTLSMVLVMEGMVSFDGLDGMMGPAGWILSPVWLMLVFWLLVVVGLVLLVVWGTQYLAPPQSTNAHEVPLATLQRRLAQGEIGCEEYEAAREILLRDGGNQ